MKKKQINSYDILLNILKVKGNEGVKYKDYLGITNRIKSTFYNSNTLNNYSFTFGNFHNKGIPYIIRVKGIGQEREYFIKDDDKSKEIFNKYEEDTNLFIIIHDYYLEKDDKKKRVEREKVDPNLGKRNEEVFPSSIFTKKI